MARKLFLHNFPNNTALFPSFSTLPTEDGAQAVPPLSPSSSPSHFLVAQISENMTLTQPTLILLDRNTSSFALTFEDVNFSLKGFKKGHTIVVPDARLTKSKEEGKKGFVRIGKEEGKDVRVIGGGFERVVLLGTEEEREKEGKRAKCGGCEKSLSMGEGGGNGGKLCLGCGWVRYCSKVSSYRSVS